MRIFYRKRQLIMEPESDSDKETLQQLVNDKKVVGFGRHPHDEKRILHVTVEPKEGP